MAQDKNDLQTSKNNYFLHNSSIYTTGDISDLTPADSSLHGETVHLANTSSSSSSTYTKGDILDVLSADSSSVAQHANPLSGLQFLDRNDLLVKLSRMVFEDFHNNIFALNADAQDETFLDVLQRFLEICEAGVKGIEQICDDAQIDPNSKAMMTQLSLERIMLFNACNFIRFCFGDAEKLSLLDNIYACTKMRGSVHIDSRFVDRIAAEDEEAVQTLNRVLFALFRAGRLDDAKTLLNDLKVPALSTFIFVREFLTNTRLSPLERFDEMFDFARSRLFFKQTARELIPADDVRVQKTDQCIWATLGADLATLLSHAQSTEDRLWSYLSCAAESLLDDALLKVHAKGDDELNLLAMDIQRREGTDSPKDVHAIFSELRNSECRSYYVLFEHLSMEQWDSVAESIGEYVTNSKNVDQIAAHELRFFVHLVILLKLSGKSCANWSISDQLIEHYCAMLIQMRLIAIVPFYLYHLSPEKSTEKMLDFLMDLTFVSDQKEVLENAMKAGFDVPNLCREVYRRFKDRHNFGPKIGGEAMKQAAEVLIRAWRWLAFGERDSVWDAITEANFLLRKFFLYNLMSQALQLMQLAPENLPEIALKTFEMEFPNKEIPDKLRDAQREFDCYQLYFEAISRYSEWQNHVEGNKAPELPTKLSDERWARMDIRRRTEYELSVQKAKDCLHKYYRLIELYKKRAIEILGAVLKMSHGWLVTLPLRDEDLADEEIVERAEDFVKIRKEYLANLFKLLIDIYHRSDEPMSVLDTATLIMDPSYCFRVGVGNDSVLNVRDDVQEDDEEFFHGSAYEGDREGGREQQQRPFVAIIERSNAAMAVERCSSAGSLVPIYQQRAGSALSVVSGGTEGRRELRAHQTIVEMDPDNTLTVGGANVLEDDTLT
uniref:Nuclear pore complex protein n=1 Tax=Globodera pallida TaxID=36090 RepID=A0A183BHN2_GLOPA